MSQQKGEVSDYKLMTRHWPAQHVAEQELDEKNKKHMLSAGSLKTPLP